jgi:hypothetical protein
VGVRRGHRKLQMRNIVLRAGEEVVGADDFIATLD